MIYYYLYMNIIISIALIILAYFIGRESASIPPDIIKIIRENQSKIQSLPHS